MELNQKTTVSKKKRKINGGKNRPVSARGVSDILGLVSYDIPVSVTEKWDQKTRQEVANWAYAVHLRASDNIVRIPSKPDIMNNFKEVSYDHWEKKWHEKA